MLLDKKSIYHSGQYSYKNFILLDQDELLWILEWRNHPNIRKWMANSDLIKREDHLQFAANLTDRNDVCYWLILKDKAPIGVLNMIHINYENKSCEPGFYLSPDVMGKGEGLFLLLNYKDFLLNKLGFERLYGRNLLDNIPAFQFTMFFGAEIDAMEEVEGRKYITSHLDRESFNKVSNNRLVSRYVKFIKEWDFLMLKYGLNNE